MPRRQRRTLMAAVRDVCRHARPADPTSVSQTEFNEARAAAGRPNLPRADKICARLGGVAWRRLLEIAFAAGGSEGRFVTHAALDRREKRITMGQCIAA